MDQTSIHAALDTALVHALTGLCLPDPAPAEANGGPDRSWAWSWVKTVEPWPATLVLAIEPVLCRQVAHAMLGGEADEAALPDAQRELTNIVAGRLVKEIAGPDATISLGIPRSGRGAPDVRTPAWTSRVCAIGSARVIAYWSTLSPPTHPPHRVSPAVAAALPPTPVTRPPRDEDTAVQSTVASGKWVGSLPQQFGEYKILELIGEGGMGQVFRALHTTLERVVALKAMRPEFMQDPAFTARFLQEARMAALLDHAHVVTVYDAGIEAGHLYIAMRFVGGGDLAIRVRDKGPLSEAEALPLMAKCLLGLGAIANAGMVHRDIKPANILLEADGTPRLGDLGLARAVDKRSDHSKTGSAQGTPCYMSPEQARGNEVDLRSDIYSLGASMYTALSGYLPFEGSSAYETVALVLTSAPVPLSLRTRSVSAGTIALIERAMAKEPRERFQHPLEFLDAVESVYQAAPRGGVQSVLADRGAASLGEQRGGWIRRLLRR